MQLTQTVRFLVANTFAALGIEGTDGVRETILIRGGAYCGRRFDVAGGHAVWFIEEHQVKFFGTDGSVASVIESFDAPASPIEQSAHRMAA